MTDYTVTRYRELMSWIEHIEKYGRDLTEWEDDFVGSVKNQLERKGELTVRQQEILERIYADKT